MNLKNNNFFFCLNTDYSIHSIDSEIVDIYKN